jgi:zinc protease
MRRPLALSPLSLLASLLPVLALACGESLPPDVAPRPLPTVPPPAVDRPPPPLTTPDADFRKEAPAPGPPVVFKAPTIEETKLSNGIRVLLVERHELPIVAVRVVSSQGADQAGPGVGAFAGAMMLAGTQKRSAEQLSDEFQALGAQHGAYVDYDASVLYAQSLSNKFEGTLELLADVAQHPSFPLDELKRERTKRLTSLHQEKDSPQRLLGAAQGAALYPARHPYHTPLLGTEAALEKISAADLRQFHAATFEPDRLTITASGDITRGALVEQLERSFGKWKGKAARATAPAAPPPPAAGAPKIIIVDRPGASQTNVSVTMVGVPRSTKDYDALLLMNAILGGQFSSRLNMNLREKHGYTYGAGSAFAMRHGAGPFSASGAIMREHTAAAVKEIMGEIEGIRSAPVSADELADAKGNITQQLPALFETDSQTAGTLANLAIYSLPLDDYASRPARIARVTAEDIKRVATTYLQPAQMRVVMVGDAAKIKASLEALGLGTIEVREAKADAGAAPPSASGPRPRGGKPKSDRPRGDKPKKK